MDNKKLENTNEEAAVYLGKMQVEVELNHEMLDITLILATVALFLNVGTILTLLFR